MKDKPTIKKIVFNVGGKTLELSADEAKELKQILGDLFGEPKTEHVHHYDYWWTRPYSGPCWTYTAQNQGAFSGSISNTALGTTGTLYLSTTNGSYNQ